MEDDDHNHKSAMIHCGGGGLTKKDKGRWKKLKKRASSRGGTVTTTTTTSHNNNSDDGGGNYKNSCDDTQLTNNVHGSDNKGNHRGSMSGITVKEDWILLQEYYKLNHNKNNNNNNSNHPKNKETVSGYGGGGGCCPFGPSVHLRKPINQLDSFLQITEGVDHRDIMAKFIMFLHNHHHHNNNDHHNHKKRKRNNEQEEGSQTDYSFSIPSWAVLHNPVGLEHLAILQIQLEQDAALFDWDRICQGLDRLIEKEEVESSSSSSTTTSTDSACQHSVIKTQTRWFQGPYPKAISDSLFYRQRSSNTKTMTTTTTNNTPTNKKEHQVGLMEQLIPLLEDLILSTEERQQEGYPMIMTMMMTEREEGGSLSSSSSQSVMYNNHLVPNIQNGSYQLLSLEEAKETLALYKINDISSMANVINTTDTIYPSNFVETQSHYHHCSHDNHHHHHHHHHDKNSSSSIHDVTTLPPPPAPPLPRILALDCEMVRTQVGNELARVTLVQLERWGDCATGGGGGGVPDDDNDDPSTHDNHHNNNIPLSTRVLLDEWVQPYHTVVDYLTEFSGATATILHNPTLTCRLEQIQVAMLQLVDRNDILIGHSLENDLKAIHILHGRVIDTAILFRPGGGGKCCHNNNNHNKRNTKKYSLRHLVATLLKRQIQQAGRHHCSEEDAVAALQLSVQRAIRGPAFGIHEKTSISLFDSLSRMGVTVSIGPAAWLEQHITRQPNSIHALCCESIIKDEHNSKAVLAWLTGPKRRAKLVVSQFVISNENELNAFDKLLLSLVHRISPTSLILVAFQHSYAEAKSLTNRRKACQDPRSTLGWTEFDEKNWNGIMEKCRIGRAIWIGASNCET